MKIKVAIIILVVACAALAIALFATKKQADDQHEKDVAQATEFSNKVVTANKSLDEIGQVNLTLSNDLSSSQQQISSNVEQIVQLSNSLSAANATLAEAKTSLASSQELVTNLNLRISDLEAQNKVLDEQAQSLSNRVEELTLQIEDTKTKLAIALTNVTFLQGELQRQMAAKAELEHKFNDVDELRAQIKKVKDEMFIARRIAMNNPNAGKKGGELLMDHNPPPSSATRKSASTYDLNVEVGSDGSVKVIPPMGGTNSLSH